MKTAQPGPLSANGVDAVGIKDGTRGELFVAATIRHGMR